ncbi:MAG: hypothetical protein HQ583_05345 [Candidatus Abyssubacteria bacterium]|nr:hypothetical protein [Candidatus Abyssubacteria bacterium]
MAAEETVWTEQEESLSVWCSSGESVLVIGEHDTVVTEKRTVLESYLSKAASVFTKKFGADNPAIELLKRENLKLSSENRKLKKSLDEVGNRLGIVEAQISELVGEEKIIVLREVTRDEAKEEIKELFETGQTLFYSDIADKLRIDLELVVEICQELQNEGAIEVSDNT